MVSARAAVFQRRPPRARRSSARPACSLHGERRPWCSMRAQAAAPRARVPDQHQHRARARSRRLFFFAHRAHRPTHRAARGRANLGACMGKNAGQWGVASGQRGRGGGRGGGRSGSTKRSKQRAPEFFGPPLQFGRRPGPPTHRRAGGEGVHDWWGVKGGGGTNKRRLGKRKSRSGGRSKG